MNDREVLANELEQLRFEIFQGKRGYHGKPDEPRSAQVWLTEQQRDLIVAALRMVDREAQDCGIDRRTERERVRDALADLKDHDDDIERVARAISRRQAQIVATFMPDWARELARAAIAAMPASAAYVQLQARLPNGGSDWIDIFPAQLGWMAKEGHEVRAIETTRVEAMIDE